MLRAALGGASSLTSKSATNPTLAAKSPGLFNGGSVPMSPTDIKPTYSSDNSKVGAVGGGYAKGEHASVGGKGSSFVSVDVGGPTVEEGLKKDEVGAVIHKHTDEIRYCHESALLYKPNLEGKVVVKFGIGPTGRVENATIESSTAGDKSLEQCILKKLVTWQFPKPKGGVHVNVSYPFIFKTLGGD
jgi:TonB family protein